MIVSDDNSDSKHAFLIMAHADDKTFHTLLRCLDDSRNDIYIHMDAKNVGWDSEGTISKIKSARCFVIPRIKVTWGTYSQIACELNLLESATSVRSYAFYHLLSGQDLPLKNQNQIHHFFDSRGGG